MLELKNRGNIGGPLYSLLGIVNVQLRSHRKFKAMSEISNYQFFLQVGRPIIFYCEVVQCPLSSHLIAIKEIKTMSRSYHCITS